MQREHVSLTLLVVLACVGSFASAANDDARFAPVQKLLANHIESQKIAGAVALVSERGRIVLDEAVGWRDAAAREPMRRETLFRIASMTKPVTSVAAMMLVEEGRLNLDDELPKFVPEFAGVKVVRPGEDAGQAEPAARPITVRDLLTHTSGLTYGFFGQEPHAELYAEAGFCDGLSESPLTLAESTKLLARLPLVQQPGSAWQYGMSTDVLGRVVEVASGRPFDDFVQERILDPLEMHDTHFVVPAEKLSRLATLYRPDEDHTIVPVAKGLHHVAGVAYSATYQHSGRSAYRSGGAGLVSTAADYLRFLTMLLRGGELDGVRLLQRETVRQMTSNQIGDLSILFAVHGDKFGYGFGVHSVDSQALNGASPGAYSWGGIFHTYFWVDPKREVVGVLITQLFPFDHLTLWADFQQRAYDALESTIDAGRAPGPRPNEVYREYAAHNGGNRNWRVTDPRATAPGAWQFLPNSQLTIRIDDLEHAVRAEALLDRWGGHLKTTNQRIRFNGNAWLRLPQLRTTPEGRASFYYTQDNPVIDVPLEHLHEGTNSFDGTCATRDGYNWGQWGLYSLILRIYYDESRKPHGGGEIVSPGAVAEFADNPTIEVRTTGDVERVDVLAYYDGEDEDGDGVFRDWHGAYHQLARGKPAVLSGHVGADSAPPFELRWDTKWVPDQRPRSVQLVARLQDSRGVWTVTEPVTKLTLRRADRRVALYRSADAPERFGVRVGQERSCTIRVPDDAPLDAATDARLALRTWHGWDGHHEPLRFNDRDLPIQGNNHHYDFDRLPIPVGAIRHGTNMFRIRSETEHHMLEVLWPGPWVLVRYGAGG